MDQAHDKLWQLVTLNYFVPTPIEEILAELEETTETTILVDWAAPSAAKSMADPRSVLQVQDRPLCKALVELLQPLDLGYRIVGPDLFEVTTRTAAADRLELEFYPVKELLAAAESGESLVERIRSQISPGSWSGEGGKGVVLEDRPSGHLLVLQSQAVQASVQMFLGKLATEKASPEKKGPPR